MGSANNHHHHHHDHITHSSFNKPCSSSKTPFFVFPKLMISLIFALSFFYLVYSVSIVLSPSSPPCPTTHPVSAISNVTHLISSSPPPPTPATADNLAPRTENKTKPTGLEHIVFGIAASSSLWDKRKHYIKIWWRPRQMRGFVWLDKPVRSRSPNLPPIKISSDTSKFPYSHPQGHRSAVRISRIVSETHRLNLPDVRWFVMGDDDTVFIPDNLVRVLAALDHTQPYYIGSPSESHLQNIYFSYSMAYGGGGFAISAPLAAALAGVQDRCLHRYPKLYGSDDRIHACMAELGVPLTRHPGFHQNDVYGDLLGLLAAHPVAPLVSVHHLDVVQPIFPSLSRPDSLKKLFDGPVRLDSAGLMQQSICYDSKRWWTVSVSWGFVAMVVRGVISPREMEMPARTFLNWYKRADYTAYAFNTRPVARNPCQRPFVFYLSSARFDRKLGTTVTEYKRHEEKHPACKWKMEDPSSHVDRIVVYKKPDPGLWERSPRRNCCRVLPMKEGNNKTMGIDVGVCRAGEISET